MKQSSFILNTAFLSATILFGCVSPEAGDPGIHASDSPEVLREKEAIRSRFMEVFEAYLVGQATASALDEALRCADRDLVAFPDSSWNGGFEAEPKGLSSARVLVATDHLVPEARAWALDHLDRAGDGEKLLRAALATLEGVRRERLGALGRLDLADRYDLAHRLAGEALAELGELRAWAARPLPEGETDLLSAGADFWKPEGGLSFDFRDGSLLLRGSGEGGRLDSLHFYLLDVTIRMTLHIEKGGLDLLVRSVPGRKSTLSMGINRGEVPDPLVLLVKVAGDTAEFLDPDGNTLQEITTDRAPSGGGLAFRLHRESVVRITELVLER